jgi:pyruvate dehydrogenase E2 component (dihydrolipoamide acetyltransferase)
MSVFKLPDLGEGLPDAVVREWYVAEGDTVAVDQPLVAMETAKALVDVPAPFAGVIATLHGQVGDTIDTGAPLITFQGTDNASEEEHDAGTVVGNVESSNKVIASEKGSMQQVRERSSSGIKATPQVRMLAQQLGVDLASLNSGAPITADDVKQAAGAGGRKARPQQNFTGTAIKLNQVRRAMVQSMEQSLSEIVPVTLVDDANIQSWVGKADMTVRILRAIANACQQEKNLNAFFDSTGECIYQQESINVGLAVDTPEGLFVPVMKDISNRSDDDLRAQINQFKDYAQNKSFPAEELKGATILLSNFGTFAGRYANPVLVPPLVTIIGVGKARVEPAVVDGEIQACKILPLSVTADHRAVTGGELSRFLAALLQNLGS